MLQANWIETGKDLGTVSPVFLKEFSCPKAIERATLRISARGVYEAVLNGKRVGDFILAPGWTSYKHRIQVQEYDVTAMLGESNRLTVQLAACWHGWRFWWDKDLVEENAPLALIAELTLQYADGEREVIGTDTDWTFGESPLRFCKLYDGIVYDATFTPTFGLHPIISADNSQEKLVPQQGEKIVENERLPVLSVITTPKGETVLDFGQNMTGYLEFTADAKAGDKVSFSFAEILDRDGNFYNENYRVAKCLYDYTCRDGKQTYKPNLTFYGFRYIRVDSYPGEIRPECFTAIVVHSELRPTGKIETSDPMLNQLFHNIVWGQKSNYLDVPTDCPQRDERLGWTGDAQVFVRTASYNYDVRKFFYKWLTDMKLDQWENGWIPDVIPAVIKGIASPAWGDAVTVCPWQLYLTYGETEFLSLMFPAMKKWVDFCGSEEDKTRGAYGDWLELKAPYGECKGATRDILIRDAFYARSLEIVCKTGRILGEDVSEYEMRHAEAVAHFKSTYGTDLHTQTEHVLPLYFDLCDDPKPVIESLVRMIHEDGDKLQTGFVGTPYLLHVLSRYGYDELAYTLLLRREYPSWLYPITKGATTMWEHWDGIKPDGQIWPASMNSYNHYAYGAVGDFLYGVCGGINPVEEAPGFARIRFAPKADARLSSFAAEFDSMHGKVRSAWHFEGETAVYEITTPVPAEVEIGGRCVAVESGTHRFKA